MRRPNFLKQKLAEGKAVLGTWAIIPSPVTADIIASTGLDFIIIDAEHGPLSFETAQQMAIACEARGVSPVMRVPDLIPWDITRALDIGVHAVQVPNIKTRQAVEELVTACKYPPEGNRGFSPFTRAGNYSLESALDHTKIANENTLVAINIEGEEAFSDLDGILSVPMLDIVFVGLFDLSKSLGIPGEVNNPRVLKRLEEIAIMGRQKGKHIGTITTSEESISRYINMGLTYIVHLVDCDMLRSAYAHINDVFRQTLNKPIGNRPI